MTELRSTCLHCKAEGTYNLIKRNIDGQLPGWQFECRDCYSRTPVVYDESITNDIKDDDARPYSEKTLWARL